MSFIKSYPIALVLFSLVIVAVFVTASSSDGLWTKYGYSPTGNVTSYDKITSMNEKAEDLSKDVLGEEGKPPATSFLDRITQGAFGSMVTLFNFFTVPSSLLTEITKDFQLDPIIAFGLKTVLLLALAISVILLIFNRSDAA